MQVGPLIHIQGSWHTGLYVACCMSTRTARPPADREEKKRRGQSLRISPSIAPVALSIACKTKHCHHVGSEYTIRTTLEGQAAIRRVCSQSARRDPIQAGLAQAEIRPRASAVRDWLFNSALEDLLHSHQPLLCVMDFCFYLQYIQFHSISKQINKLPS
jgi:hypothetical protein